MSAQPANDVSVVQNLLDATSTCHVLEATAELGGHRPTDHWSKGH